MLHHWYRTLHFPMSIEQFAQLPRHPAYKYEYIDGEAWLTPRPKTYNALLELTHRPDGAVMAHGESIAVRSLESTDWGGLPSLFAAAFSHVPPFGALGDAERLQAAGECLLQTETGGDGPLLEPACLVARETNDDHLIGAILITLIPRREEGETWAAEWDELPTTDSARRLLGRPHLTWIFVAPRSARRGVGSALLDRAINALIQLGYTDLASTFLLGNESTMLWHWRNGFRALPHQWSLRGR